MSAYVYLCVCAHGDVWVCMCRACLVLRYHRFSTAHIWACPPRDGEDYIFHCHPSEQKMPKPKRLVELCHNMLERGKDQGVVHSYMVGKHLVHAGVWEVVMVSVCGRCPWTPPLTVALLQDVARLLWLQRNCATATNGHPCIVLI